MFTAFSDSLSQIFNTSARATKMLPPDHKCGENQCSGSRFEGCNLVCCRCLNPKYIECIYDRNEICELLKVLNIEPDQPVCQRIASENTNKIRALFGPKSLLQFVCPSCDSDGTYLDIKTDYENKIKSLQKRNTDLRKENKTLNEESEKYKEKNDTKSDNSNLRYDKCGGVSNDNDILKNELDSCKTKMNENKKKMDDLIAENESLISEVNLLKTNTNEESNGIYDDVIKKNEDLQKKIESLNAKLSKEYCNKCEELG